MDWCERRRSSVNYEKTVSVSYCNSLLNLWYHLILSLAFEYLLNFYKLLLLFVFRIRFFVNTVKIYLPFLFILYRQIRTLYRKTHVFHVRNRFLYSYI